MCRMQMQIENQNRVLLVALIQKMWRAVNAKCVLVRVSNFVTVEISMFISAYSHNNSLIRQVEVN